MAAKAPKKTKGRKKAATKKSAKATPRAKSATATASKRRKKMTGPEKAREASEAKQLLENKAFIQCLWDAEAQVHESWADSEPGDSEFRETLYFQQRAIRMLPTLLTASMRSRDTVAKVIEMQRPIGDSADGARSTSNREPALRA